MLRLLTILGATSLLLALGGCEADPEYTDIDKPYMLGVESTPVGDPSAEPYRPDSPVQLVIPAGPPPERPEQ